ncbi:MAG: MerR family transcriptional regulator [Bacteroidota bacterium]|jgi:DNA-binding transcriptional MerR regulator|nr:MerR family transcriptional regulator [Bacteroidota bacterium]
MLTTGQLAKTLGVTTTTIRLYVNMGLITPSSVKENGYFQFDENSIEKIRYIRKMQNERYTLKEIKQMMTEGGLING